MKPVIVALGYAADPQGEGVLYLRRAGEPGDPVVRIGFRVARAPALLEREVTYAAMLTACEYLRKRRAERVRFLVDDERLAADLRERRDLPGALTLAYVRLRCALNQFRSFGIAPLPAADRDLIARARSDITMHVAA